MTVTDNILIVEDELDWRKIYEDVARSHGLSTVLTAHDLAGAEVLLDKMKFAVAFVDVGLDVGDDRNIDGLRVMEKIRSLGDETAVIVVTGRSGMDILPIARDAIKKYDAYDTVGKVPLEPDDIARLLASGLDAYKKATAGPPEVYDVLRGNRESWDWEHQMLRANHVSGGAAGLHDLLDRLVARFLPLVPNPAAPAMMLDADTSVAHGAYWSRAVGSAVLVAFGPEGSIRQLAMDAGARLVLGQYDADVLLHSASAGPVHGAVYSLPAMVRNGFG